jgi:transposase
MLSFSAHQNYYIYTLSVDMRKGYDGLSGIVTNEMGRRPTDGSVYIFFNGTRDKVKMLIWDVDGYVIYGKRLEKGRFEQILSQDTSHQYQIAYKHLVMLMSGISLIGMRQKPRYDMGITK